MTENWQTSLTRTTPTELSVARRALSAVSIDGAFALFGGGNDRSNSLATVDAYDVSLTRTVQTDLNVPRDTAAASVGDYALFGGGRDGSDSIYSTVDAYGII